MSRKPSKAVRPVGQARLVDAPRARRQGTPKYGVGFTVSRQNGELEIDLSSVPEFVALQKQLAIMTKALKEADLLT